ncbi:MAG: hypothetical protein SNJ71_00010 [Bacteroidales bacterium]
METTKLKKEKNEVFEEKTPVSVKPPRHGWIVAIRHLTGYSTLTIVRAVRENTGGAKSEHVRKLYNQLLQEGKI